MSDPRSSVAIRPIKPARWQVAAIAALTVLLATLTAPVLTQSSGPVAVVTGPITLADQPLFTGGNLPPIVMLNITKDQQLFKKAYNDYSDLNGDGQIETTYRHSIDYYGYFDPRKCYSYVPGSKRFEPTRVSDSKLCGGNPEWSGNFLNWATMTRIDVVRKILYGGLRSPNRASGSGDGDGLNDGDTSYSTVLERSFLPTDAHAFVKVYNPADPNSDGTPLEQLTPFSNVINTTTSTTAAAINTSDRQYYVASMTGITDGAIVEACRTGSSDCVRGTARNIGSNNFYLRSITSLNLSGSGSAITNWTIKVLSNQGISICNATLGSGSGSNEVSETNQNLPRMRVARGNHALWNANERWQCYWSEEKSASNGNVYGSSGLPASSSNPSRATQGLVDGSGGVSGARGDYFVRVKACANGLADGAERCEGYPGAPNYPKPIGLLQTYGENDRIRFGLLTGSYRKNTSGGVLRKNAGPLDDEIDTQTGVFISLSASGTAARPAPGEPTLTVSGGGLIDTLNRLRISGYRYDDGTFFNSSVNDDQCPFQMTDISDDRCRSWGNPMAEVYYETLRYLGGQTSATSAFNADDSAIIPGMKRATWPSDRRMILSDKNYCAPLKVLVFNAAVSTNEDPSQMGGLSFLQGSPASVAYLTQRVGDQEGLGGSFFFGKSSATGTTDSGYELCTAKSMTGNGLGDVFGLCPEGPSLGGSYLIAGLANHVRVNRVRTDLDANLKPDDKTSLKVETFGVALASNTPQIPIYAPGDNPATTEPRIVLQPAYRLDLGSGRVGGGALVEMNVINTWRSGQKVGGRLMLSWEDSEQGGDYDMDVWGLLEYEADFTAGTLRVRTRAIHQATANPQGFGYIVSGTTQDGPHFHSGVLGFNFAEALRLNVQAAPTGRLNSNGGCAGCQAGDDWSEVRYAIASPGSAGRKLNDPLWYAAKYGGFKDIVSQNNRPDDAREWDTINNRTNEPGADGLPDNYAMVTNPLVLEQALDRIFGNLAQRGSASALSTDTQRIVTDAWVFQASFDSGTWSGDLQALRVSPATTAGGLPTVATSASWSAASQLGTNLNPDQRVILTWNRGTVQPRGVPFRWPGNPAGPSTGDLSPSQVYALTPTATEAPTLTQTQRYAVGADRLAWLRGDRRLEGTGASQLRVRGHTVLGDIVNAAPAYVAAPNAGYADPDYLSFRNTWANRKPMVYVGANDGMLHGFYAPKPNSQGVLPADAGREALAYVPGRVYDKLARLTARDYTHRFSVDGSPTVADAKIHGQWRTLLVGGLGAGGQGLYALDVTDPNQFSEANAANLVRWEFSDADDRDLGYVFGKPLIRKMANGKWYAIVSTGVNHNENDGNTSGASGNDTPGRGALLIIDLEGPGNGSWTKGTNYFELTVPVGASSAPTWLGTPNDADLTGDGKVDYLYAGDLQGNVWKFDVQSADPSLWGSGAKIERLFTAHGGNYLQPITQPPQITVGPGFHGMMVLVGTGMFISTQDVSPPGPAYRRQQIYGLWDRNNGSGATCASGCPTAQISTSSLFEHQYVASETVNGEVYSMLEVTGADKPSYYLDPSTVPSGQPSHNGWTLALKDWAIGERIAWPMQLVSGFLYASSLIPSEVSSCGGDTRGAEYLLDPLYGGRLKSGSFDVNRDGKILRADASSNQDTFVVGQQNVFASRRLVSGSAVQTTFMHTDQTTVGIANSTALATQANVYPGIGYGRIGWREILAD